MAQKVPQLRHFEMGPKNGDPAYLFFLRFLSWFYSKSLPSWFHRLHFGPIDHNRPQWVLIGRAISFYAQFINTRYEGGKSGEVGQKLTDKKCRIQPKVK